MTRTCGAAGSVLFAGAQQRQIVVGRRKRHARVGVARGRRRAVVVAGEGDAGRDVRKGQELAVARHLALVRVRAGLVDLHGQDPGAPRHAGDQLVARGRVRGDDAGGEGAMTEAITEERRARFVVVAGRVRGLAL